MARSHAWHVLMLISVLLLVGLPTTSDAAGGVLFVRAGAQGAGDGSSWADAYPTLQGALLAAPADSAIWVAEGTYRPSPSDRSASFVLPDAVALYGGFVGTEADLAQRDWSAHPTILSGDLLGDDAANGTNAENSYHVVRSIGATASSRLDGFIIAGGYANGASPPDANGAGLANDNSSPTLANLTISGNAAADLGGGLYNVNSSPTLSNVTLSGNAASHGGGIYNDDSSPTLNNVTFSGNSATSDGGGLYNNSGSPTLSNVTLSGNRANYGGGLYNNSGSPTLSNVTLSNNTATSNGGGLYNNSGSPTLSNVTFSGNAADLGGGMYTIYGSPTLTNVSFTSNTAGSFGGGLSNSGSPTLTNVSFTSNTAGSFGGGLSNSGSPTLTNASFTSNTAGSFGGGLFNYDGSPTLSNVSISGNTAGLGGGLFNSGGSTLINVSISGNTARGGGGGVFNLLGGLRVLNSIIWGNSPSAIDNGSGGLTTVQDSLIEGGYPGSGILTDDPQFITPIDPANAPTTAGNLRLRPTSPAIDAGLDSAVPAGVTTDRDGNARLVDLPAVGSDPGRRVDMGAYESPVVRVAGSTLLDANPTSAAQVRFRLTFTTPVSGVTLADLRLTALGVRDAGVVAVEGSGGSYIATVSTGSGVGTLRLDVPASASVADALGYPLGDLPYTSGAFYLREQRTVDSITLTASPSPATAGQVVTLQASISATSGTPSGSITFQDGTTVLGSAPLDTAGQAVLTTSSLTAGAHALAAAYSGDATFAGGTSAPIVLLVNMPTAQPTALELLASPNPATAGQVVTLRASISAASGIPSGSITFQDGTTALGSAPLNAAGQAVLTTGSLNVGSHPLRAVYGGDAVFAGSVSNQHILIIQPVMTTPSSTTIYLPLIQR